MVMRKTPPSTLFQLNDTRLKGKHNIQNILAAATIAHSFGITNDIIKETITNFKPIQYRLEWIGNINDVDYFNDSKATNINSVEVAIESFNNIILILGGSLKGDANFSQLIPKINERVNLFGDKLINYKIN